MATGRARGFAFVEMSTDEEAQKAITELNDYQLGGRGLTVNEARPKPASVAVAGLAAAIPVAGPSRAGSDDGPVEGRQSLSSTNTTPIVTVCHAPKGLNRRILSASLLF